MSPERNRRMRMEDILACNEKFQTYTQGMTYEQFCADGKTVVPSSAIWKSLGTQPGSFLWKFGRSTLNWHGWRCGDEKYHGTRILWHQYAYHLAGN